MKFNLCFFALILCGCDKGPEAVLDVNVAIHYLDSNGKELFANGLNGYIANNVRLYYNKNNERIMVNTARPGFIPDYPNGFVLDSSTTKKYFAIFSNTYVVHDTSITFINLKPGVEDTLKCSFIQPNSNTSSIQVEKVWYNGRLVSRSFEVVK